VRLDDVEAWRSALREMLTDDQAHATLVAEAVARPLPTCADAARRLLREA
jgi:hypothetical protein